MEPTMSVLGSRSWRRPLALALLLPLLAACNITRVQRIDTASVTDLSGRWNDTDSRLVANALIEQSLGGAWSTTNTGGSAPAVMVGEFRNRTMEHIPIATFTRDLERAMVSSNTVRVVASRDERGELREERMDQQQYAAPETRARLGRELGARYLLQGDVQAIEDRAGRERVVLYQVDATLIDLETNAKVWAGQHKIKKYVQRRRITG
jgi:penicillin-binding protein activator